MKLNKNHGFPCIRGLDGDTFVLKLCLVDARVPAGIPKRSGRGRTGARRTGQRENSLPVDMNKAVKNGGVSFLENTENDYLMSIIFKALKKQKAFSRQSGESGDRRQKGAAIYSFHRIVFSPLILIFLAACVVLAGFGAYHGLGFMMSGFQHSAPPPPRKPENSRPRPAPPSQATRIEPPPAPAKTAAPDKPAVFESIQAPKPKPFGVYHPPSGTDDAISEEPLEPTSTVDPSPAPATEPPSKLKTVEKLAATEAAAPEETSAPQAGEDHLGDPKPESSDQAEERLQLVNLVKKIEKAMAESNHALTEDLLRRLEDRMGKNNEFVLKLKAFWHLRNARYQDAAMLLGQVLAANEEDMEAGINMAILEIKTGKSKEAQKRLEMLHRQNPDNTLITELLDKIQQQ